MTRNRGDKERSNITPTKIQELGYELRVRQVMATDVATVSPDCTMDCVKELLRTKRISGMPIVSDGELVGMMSLEKVIRSLENGEMDHRVRDVMTGNVESVFEGDTVITAVSKFARFGYGRFPVVDSDGKLVGILTKGDILRGLLKQMDELWQQEEQSRHEYHHIFEDIESDETTLLLTYAIAPHDFDRGGEASSKIKRALERLGANPKIVRRVAVATYEAEINVMIHSHGGEIAAQVRPDVVRVIAQDIGPGICDVEQAMRAGYSTAPDWIRELGFGAGMGLSNIKACSDEMTLESSAGSPTRLEMVFKLSHGTEGKP